MNDLSVAITALVSAYFFGAIPSGVIIGRLWRGVDIRSYGSGGSGATNVNRTLGPRAGAVVLASDITKGLLVTGIVRYLVGADAWLIASVGTVTVLGHMFPAYIQFRGGKGVATGLGALAIISPISAVIALSGVIIALVSKFVSLGSIIGTSLSLGALIIFSAFEFRIGMWDHDRWYLLFAIPVSILIIWSHQANIERLTKGDESKLENKAAPRRAQ